MNLFDRYYKRYDGWYKKNKFAYLSEVAAIKRILPKGGRGLEIGVGTGRFASALGTRYGVDPSKNMLRFAKRRGINVLLSAGERLPFRDRSFSYVTIIITICFVNHPKEVLREAKRVLRKGGKLIVGIIDKNSFLGRFYQNKKSVFYKHARFFSVNELVSFLKSIGFYKFTFYQTIFDFPDKINKVEEPKKGFGRGGFVAIGGKKRI